MQATKATNKYLQSVKSHLGHLPEDERSAILDNLEAQIHEALNSRCRGAEPTPEDVNAILAEMDPPEAFSCACSEVSGSGPRPGVGKAALTISIVGIILSVVITGYRVFAGTHMDFVHRIAIFVVCSICLIMPWQVLALVIAAFSKGDRYGRKATIISVSLLILGFACLVLFYIVARTITAISPQ
jgi:hypothetical protein